LTASSLFTRSIIGLVDQWALSLPKEEGVVFYHSGGGEKGGGKKYRLPNDERRGPLTRSNMSHVLDCSIKGPSSTTKMSQDLSMCQLGLLKKGEK